MLDIPILVADQALGVIVLNRHLVAPFEERTVDLATTFATQVRSPCRTCSYEQTSNCEDPSSPVR